MTIRTKVALKAFFETNDTPSESNFGDLIDTLAELTSPGTWVDYSATSSIIGWTSYTVKKIWYRTIGNIFFCQYNISGVSDAVTVSFTLPYSQNAAVSLRNMCRGSDNGGAWAVAMLYLPISSNTVQIFSNPNSQAWTGSGNKGVQGQFWMEK